MKGGKPKSDKEKAISGTLRADRVNNEAPISHELIRVPPPPDDLTTDKIKSIWNDTGQYLFDNKLLSPEVLPILIAYCCEWQRYYVKLETGKETYSCLNTIIRLAGEMGITPASRSKVKTGVKKDQKDELGEILNIE